MKITPRCCVHPCAFWGHKKRRRKQINKERNVEDSENDSNAKPQKKERQNKKNRWADGNEGCLTDCTCCCLRSLLSLKTGREGKMIQTKWHRLKMKNKKRSKSEDGKGSRENKRSWKLLGRKLKRARFFGLIGRVVREVFFLRKIKTTKWKNGFKKCWRKERESRIEKGDDWSVFVPESWCFIFFAQEKQKKKRKRKRKKNETKRRRKKTKG